MGFQIYGENDGLGVLVVWDGSVNGGEAIEANSQIYERDPDGKYCYQIWDFSDADVLDVSAEELRVVVMQDYANSQINPEQIVAVVGTDTVLKGLDDLYRSFIGAWTQFESKTFASVDDAREWVNERCGCS